MTSFLAEDARIAIDSFPFRYMVIENFLKPALADAAYQAFERAICKATPIGKVGEVGDLQYSAVNYIPDLLDLRYGAASLFCQEDVRMLICGALGADANDCFMLGSHRHEPPSRDGWSHTDCAIVSFPPGGPMVNGMNVFQPNSGCVYADDSLGRQPDARKVARSVACLYYLGNRDWQPGDGGETAIYDDDRKTILRTIPPTHNSLFAFEVSPNSYHGYLGSPNSVRDSMIWWYHCEIPDLIERHQKLFDRRTEQRVDPWDRWTGPEVVKYDTVLHQSDPNNGAAR